MKVSAINTVRFNNNYSNVNFEGKKDKKSNASAPISSTLKAVPVAVMLAMSPIATTNAGEIMNQNTVELAQIFDDDIIKIESEVYDKTPDVTKKIPEKYKSYFVGNIKKFDCGHIIVANNINQGYIFASDRHNLITVINAYERFRVPNGLFFDKYAAYNIDLKKIEVNPIFYKDENGEQHIKFKYYAQGPGWIYNTDKSMDIFSSTLIPNNDQIYEEKDDIKIEIDKDFYNTLKNYYGSKIENVKKVLHE